MRPRLAVSACLLGQRVRYDGDHRAEPELMAELSRHCELEPICPEAGAGLGVPRPPVRLVRTARGLRALGVEDSRLDVTDALTGWARAQLTRLALCSGMVLKARSPSCASGTVPIHDSAGREQGHGDGLFVAAVRAARPGLPVADEEILRDPQSRQRFLAAVQRQSAAIGQAGP